VTNQRRRPPEPAIPVGGQENLAPPQPFVPLGDPQPLSDADNPNVLLSSENVTWDDMPPEENKLPPAWDGQEEDQGESLTDEESIMFSSLLTCGRRSKTITLFDHVVTVETLNGDDDLRIGLYAKDYAGSLGEQRAYQIGVVAAGLRTIDGKAFAQTLFEDAQGSLFDDKVKKVSSMRPVVISPIYRAIMDAEKEFVELATRLGKLPG
jgi:hypothetical protein